MFVSRWLLFISLPFFSFSLMSGKKEKRERCFWDILLSVFLFLIRLMVVSQNFTSSLSDMIFLLRICFLYKLLLWCNVLVISALKQPFSSGGVVGEEGCEVDGSLSSCWWGISKSSDRTFVPWGMSSKRNKAGHWIYSNYAFVYKMLT